MSAPVSPAEPPAPPATIAFPVTETNSNVDVSIQQRKSYRRKYRKIMVKFEERMQESNGLFKDEQRIYDISQRLAEQTDQLLQLLLELNDRPQVPSRMRYDLEPASDTSNNLKPQRHRDEQSTLEELRLARNRVQKGEMTPFEYQQMQQEFLDSAEYVPSKSYASLIRMMDLTRPELDRSEANSSVLGALSIKQEEQYLLSLDDYLDGKNSNARAHASKSLGSRTAERTADREREMQLKNPVSVYNWLRKHQPQVFLQDHEASAGDKATKSAGSRSSKRTAQKEVKQENDYYDEDGIAMEHTTSARGKRKRDEDTAFRPKGGRSGHPAKRRKDDGGGKRSKRSSMDARNI